MYKQDRGKEIGYKHQWKMDEKMWICKKKNLFFSGRGEDDMKTSTCLCIDHVKRGTGSGMRARNGEKGGEMTVSRRMSFRNSSSSLTRHECTSHSEKSTKTLTWKNKRRSHAQRTAVW